MKDVSQPILIANHCIPLLQMCIKTTRKRTFSLGKSQLVLSDEYIRHYRVADARLAMLKFSIFWKISRSHRRSKRQNDSAGYDLDK